jgi:type II secretion system protein D
MNRCLFAICPLLAALALLLGGCQGLRPSAEENTAADPEAYRSLATAVLAPKPLNEALVVDKIAPRDAGGIAENLVFPQSSQTEMPKIPIAEYPDKLLKGIKDPDTIVPVSLNLDNATIDEIVASFSVILGGFGYQIDPSVKGAVTISMEADMTAREAWEMFEHILWLSGAYASKNPGFIHIMPFSRMPKERRILARHEPHANVEVAFIPVFHVKSGDIIKNIQPFMTDGATVTDLTAENTLLIVEAPPNMPKLRELITRLDNKGEADWPHICVQCHEVDAEELQAELEALLPVLGYSVASQGPSGGQIKLTALPRLQTIVASAALPEVLRMVEDWVKVLDRGSSDSREDIFFYDAQHSTAEKLNEMLAVFFNTDSTSSSRSSSTKSTSAKATATTGTTTTTTEVPRATPASSANRARSTDTEGETIFDTPVVVFVDQENNRLSIQTTPRAWPLVLAMLERHDINPRLVLVEAKIVEVSLGKNTEFGFAYAAEHSNLQVGMSQMGSDDAGTARAPWTSTTTSWAATDSVAGLYPANAASFSSGTGGAAIGYLQGDVMAFVNAVAGEGNSQVLASPQIMATNGVEAKINIGRKVSIKTTEYSSDYKSSYEYQDTGVILTVTPYITAGNDVRLEIEQEVSSVIEGTGGEGSPDISNKTLLTTLIIPDGGTAFMGGLIDTTNSQGHTGVPFLKDIPGVGRLFRTNQSSSSRNELLVLITVNVLDTNSDTTLLLRRYQAALREIREQLD